MEVLDTLKGLSVSHRRSLRDDDFFVDRLHHRYTVALLVAFCVIVTANQYAGEPINCWVPAQFTGSFETYTNRLCWLQNTYYVHDDSEVPDEAHERHRNSLKYYQWVNLILLFQALLFILPRVMWRGLNDKCGIEIVNYVDAAMKYETVDKYEDREKIMDFLSGNILRFINARETYREQRTKVAYKIKRAVACFLFWTGKRLGNYLVILYMFTKFLYLANVIGQLFLMTKLLGIENYHALGFEILRRMAKGMDMVSNHYFPKVTHCDFKVRELGQFHHYTVQCVLAINIFTEKIYIIIWFWFVILTTLTVLDIVSFMIKNLLPMQRYAYVKKHVLIFSPLYHEEQKKALKEFCHKHLKPDVVIMLHILARNVNGMVVSELVKKLWDLYCHSHSIDTSSSISHSSEDDEESKHERDNPGGGDDEQQPQQEKPQHDDLGPFPPVVKMREKEGKQPRAAGYIKDSPIFAESSESRKLSPKNNVVGMASV